MKYLFLALFVGLLVGSGLVGMRRTKNVGDFFLGNRSVGPWLSAFAYGTTYFSAVLFIGYAGKVGWGFGFSALWIAVGNAFVGSFLAWRLLAKRTRAMTSNLGEMTMPGFLHARYDSPGLRKVSALVIFIFLLPYSASVYMGLSYLFEQSFGINYLYANLFMACLTALFLVMGGYLAVAVTDLVQGSIMFVGAGLILFFVFSHDQVAGISNAMSKLATYNPELTQIIGPPGAVPLFSLVVLTSLGAWGLPQMIQKFYAIKDENSIKPATIIASIFAMVIGFVAYSVGAVSRLFFNNQIPLLNGVPNYDVIIPKIIVQAMPEVVAAVVLLLVLSASMSTLSSLVLVSSSAIAIDLRKGATGLASKGSPTLMRILCTVFIAISFAISVWRPTFILNLMALSWGTVAGAFLAPYLYGLFWPRTTKAGAWAGLLSGVTISLVLSFFGNDLSTWLGLGVKFDPPLSGSLAMLVPLVVVPLVSLVTPPLSDAVLEKAYNTGATETAIFVAKESAK